MADEITPLGGRLETSSDRRSFLKAGVAMAAAPFVAGLASAALPANALAAKKSAISKKILVISASPRTNSNSDALCDEFMRGARQSGHTVEKIRLAEKTIRYCTGCLACISDPGSCVQDDDMAEIHKKMLDADVIVLGSPVYFHAMNGQMKVFIDRVCPIYSMIRDKDFYYAVSCAGGASQADSAVESLKVFTRSFTGARDKGVMSVTGKWDAGQVKGARAGEEAYEMGRNA